MFGHLLQPLSGTSDIVKTQSAYHMSVNCACITLQPPDDGYIRWPKHVAVQTIKLHAVVGSKACV